MTGHQRAFDNVERPRRLLARFLGVGGDELRDAVHQRVAYAIFDGSVPPSEIDLRLLGAVALELGGDFQKPLGRVRTPIEDHVLDAVAQPQRNIVVDVELAGINDAHVHAGGDRIVEEDRVHRAPHRLIAAEAERNVGDAARDVRVLEFALDAARRLDEIDGVVVVFFDSGRDREDVGIEDDVFGRETDFLSQKLVGAGANLELAVLGVRLPLLVERHDNDAAP